MTDPEKNPEKVDQPGESRTELDTKRQGSPDGITGPGWEKSGYPSML